MLNRTRVSYGSYTQITVKNNGRTDKYDQQGVDKRMAIRGLKGNPKETTRLQGVPEAPRSKKYQAQSKRPFSVSSFSPRTGLAICPRGSRECWLCFGLLHSGARSPSIGGLNWLGFEIRPGSLNFQTTNPNQWTESS